MFTQLIFLVQVLGHKEGLSVMERADPLFLLIGLPMVPVSLILSKMIRWEDFILRLWRKHCTKLPIISYFFQPGVCNSQSAGGPLLLYLS